MLVTHRLHNGAVTMKLEPELNRLARAYRHIGSELKKADEKGLAILRVRLMRKFEQIRGRIQKTLARLGHDHDSINRFLNDMDNYALEEPDNVQCAS